MFLSLSHTLPSACVVDGCVRKKHKDRWRARRKTSAHNSLVKEREAEREGEGRE
jgi:hypothetical protein